MTFTIIYSTIDPLVGFIFHINVLQFNSIKIVVQNKSQLQT